MTVTACQESSISAEEAGQVSKRTLTALSRYGWCLWKCAALGDEVIAVVQDRDILEKQMSFTGPLRRMAQYPVYTVPEIRELAKLNDREIRFVHKVKKRFGMELTLVTFIHKEVKK